MAIVLPDSARCPCNAPLMRPESPVPERIPLVPLRSNSEIDSMNEFPLIAFRHCHFGRPPSTIVLTNRGVKYESRWYTYDEGDTTLTPTHGEWAFMDDCLLVKFRYKGKNPLDFYVQVNKHHCVIPLHGKHFTCYPMLWGQEVTPWSWDFWREFKRRCRFQVEVVLGSGQVIRNVEDDGYYDEIEYVIL